MDEPRLAHPGLTGHEHEPWGAGDDLAEHAVQPSELVDAPDEGDVEHIGARLHRRGLYLRNEGRLPSSPAPARELTTEHVVDELLDVAGPVGLLHDEVPVEDRAGDAVDEGLGVDVGRELATLDAPGDRLQRRAPALAR